MQYNQEPPDISFDQFLISIPNDGFCWSSEPLNEVEKNILEKTIFLRNYESHTPPYLRPKTNKLNIKWIEPLKIQEPEPRKPYPQPLFIEFAELKNNQEEYLNFAEKYGNLIPFTMPQVDGRILNAPFPTPYEFWEREHAELQSAVKLWQLAKAAKEPKNDNYEKAIRKLKEHITITEEPLEINYILPSSDDSSDFFSGILNHANLKHSRLFEQIPLNDLPTIAEYIAVLISNEKMNFFKVTPTVVFTKNSTFRQVIVPSSLIAAIWFQFSQALTGNRLYKQCSICQQWVDVTDFKKSWQRHERCAIGQRVKKHREKKKEGV